MRFSVVSTREYIKHRLYDPVIYYRNFDHDLSQEKADQIKRAALLTLPFLSLYKPLGSVISLTASGVCCALHMSETVKSASKKEALATLKSLSRTAIAITTVAATFFHFKASLLMASLVDAETSLEEIVVHLRSKSYLKAMEALLQASSSVLYVSFMLSGALETMLALMLAQSLTCLWQAHQELRKGKYPETVAKVAMGTIRCRQAYQYFQKIQMRNAFLKLERFANLFERVAKSRKTEHLICSLPYGSKENTVMIDADGKEYDFGTHVHGSGKGLVKGMNLQLRSTHAQGKNMKDIHFKVNHVFRDKLESVIEEMKNFTSQEAQDFLALIQSHAKDIVVEVIPFQFSKEIAGDLGLAYKVTLKGLGQIFIGASSNVINNYDAIRVRLDENASIYELHEILTFFNLEDAIRQSSDEDIERLKIGQLFRTFFPKEATALERKDLFFTLSLNELKGEIIRQVPEMEQLMNKYLKKMQATEILPGRLRYALPDISKIAYDLGARALMATITGVRDTQEACKRVASILKMGINSTETRYRNGILQDGLCSHRNFYTGGADSVYTQMLTESNLKNKIDVEKLLYRGEVRILFSLEALNSGTYQYHIDNLGTRGMDREGNGLLQFLSSYLKDFKPKLGEDLWQQWQRIVESSSYASRSNIFNFTKFQQDNFCDQNEVMVKERIDPSMITGILVSTDAVRNELLNELRADGLVKGDGDTEEVLGVPVSKFIQVATHLSHRLLALKAVS